MKPYYEDNSAGVTIYNGDCREVLGALASGSVDAIVTDPPYGHSNGEDDFASRRHHVMKDGRDTKQEPIAHDSAEGMREVVEHMLREATRILTPERNAVAVWCGGGGPTPTFAWLADRMNRDGLSFFHSVIWDKRNPGVGWRFRRQHEMIMVSHRAGDRMNWNDDERVLPNILSYFPPQKRVHPNEKPVDLVKTFLAAITNAGQVIVDPFMGSGTTLVAAKAVGVRAIGIELEEKFCEVAVERLRQRELFGLES